MHRGFIAVAVGLSLLLAPAAQAQTAEQKALGAQVAGLIFQAISFDDLITKEIQGDPDKLFGDVRSRPEWGRFLVEAMKEEVQHDLPALEQLFGDSLAKAMSLEELKAGVALLSEPTMQQALKAYGAGGEPAGEPSREAERLASSRAGRAFLARFEKIDDLITPLEDEFVAELLPGAFRRFADKVEAGEQARKARR
jgi:hypothetical protein